MDPVSAVLPQNLQRSSLQLWLEVPEELIEKYDAEPRMHIFQVDARSEEATKENSVDITVRQYGRMIAFQLPTIERNQGEIIYSSPVQTEI